MGDQLKITHGIHSRFSTAYVIILRNSGRTIGHWFYRLLQKISFKLVDDKAYHCSLLLFQDRERSLLVDWGAPQIYIRPVRGAADDVIKRLKRQPQVNKVLKVHNMPRKNPDGALKGHHWNCASVMGSILGVDVGGLTTPSQLEKILKERYGAEEIYSS